MLLDFDFLHMLVALKILILSHLKKNGDVFNFFPVLSQNIMLVVKRNVVLQEFYCYLRCWGGDFTAVYISCGLFISFRTGRKLFLFFLRYTLW